MCIRDRYIGDDSKLMLNLQTVTEELGKECMGKAWVIVTSQQDIDERAKINTSRSVSAMVAIGIINIITVPLIGKLGSQSAKTGYLLVAIIYGCIFAACHFFCFAKTKEQVIMPEKEKISIKVQLRAVMQNRPYILALIGQVLSLIHI